MAIDFSDKVQITNPTAYHIGRYVVAVGGIALLIGLVTMFTGDLLMPAKAWCALAVPAFSIGAILIAVSVTKI